MRSDAAALRNLIMRFRVSQLIHVAAKLGIADHLQGGPLSLIEGMPKAQMLYPNSIEEHQ